MQNYFAFDNQMLPPFTKIMQNFILRENTYNRYWIEGSEICGTPFQKKCPFLKKTLFLANSERCPKFLAQALLEIVFREANLSKIELNLVWKLRKDQSTFPL